MWTRKGKRILAPVAATSLLLIAGACRMLATRQEDAMLDERIVREIMGGEAAASYAFMGGSCRIYEYGVECQKVRSVKAPMRIGILLGFSTV